jgi:hypothetical protein
LSKHYLWIGRRAKDNGFGFFSYGFFQLFRRNFEIIFNIGVDKYGFTFAQLDHWDSLPNMERYNDFVVLVQDGQQYIANGLFGSIGTYNLIGCKI